MPCHWMEQTPSTKRRIIFYRVLFFVQLAVGITYIQYRARRTIAIFDRSRTVPYMIYQIFFLVLESISISSVIFEILEVWNICKRNCIDLKQIPSNLIKSHFTHPSHLRLNSDQAKYPSVGVFIPCYNEEVDLVRQTVLGALNIEYPKQLLRVYLCDDGQDSLKKAMISKLARHHKNLFYITRPEHTHAKAGNLNYALEGTHSDLVATLDADFVPRPNFLQRLVPYYFIWNPDEELYEFNETLAVVQTPQHYRNLSPYDSDPLDQRSTFFFEIILPGKDWFNASTMIGTNNLLSRKALRKASYYPYYSITEDTAMTLKFHSLGYRTYFVNESLATGLATTSLWSNLRQRARWLKGDWQVLFSKNGPLFVKGLTIAQRLLYLHMGFGRFTSIVFLLYDIATVALLVVGVTPLDVRYPIIFIIHIGSLLLIQVLTHLFLTAGGKGLKKSESGYLAFEAIFRYTTVKGLFISLFRGQKLVFKVTEKAVAHNKDTDSDEAGEETEEDTDDSAPTSASTTNTEGLDDSFTALQLSESVPTDSPEPSASSISGHHTPHVEQRSEIEDSIDPNADARSEEANTDQPRRRKRTTQEVAERRRDIWKNLKRVWFNMLTATVLIFAIVWGILNTATVNVVDTRNDRTVGNHDLFPMAMAIGFAASNLLPHLLAIYLCFVPYVSGWMMTDLVHGRCDQYAVHPRSGKLFVPWSFILLLMFSRMTLVFGSLTFLLVYSILYPNTPTIGLP